MQIKTYLWLTGILAASYAGYTLLSNKPKHSLIPKDLTKRVSQQIKHQMMIVCITYSKAMKKIRQDNADKFATKATQLLTQFRNQLSQVYVSKENLILRKYTISRQTYGKSLEKYKNDKTIGKNITEIFDMMERALDGKLPDFTVPREVKENFNKQDLAETYKLMVTLIGKKVTLKLQEQSAKNSKFNPASDQDFRNAIRQLSIYDIKVNFLKGRGFKEEWGCPNQIFFKALEAQKAQNQDYEKKIIAYEKCYEKIIEIVSNDPKSLNDQSIDKMFSEALNQPVAAKPKVNPVSNQTIIPPRAVVAAPAPVPVKPAVVAKKTEQLNDEDLQKMMMQQLMNRSQQASQGEEEKEEKQVKQVIHPEKVGLTEEQVKEQGEQQGENARMDEATEDIDIAENDNGELQKKQQEIVDIVAGDDEKVEESAEVAEENVEVVEEKVEVVKVVEEPVEQKAEQTQPSVENVESTEVTVTVEESKPVHVESSFEEVEKPVEESQ